MNAMDTAKLIIGIGGLSLALLALAALLIHALMTWSARCRRDRYDEYWFRPLSEDSAAGEDDVSAVLAAAGTEALSGCACEGCEHLRAQAADVIFRLTADDVAELDRIGIAWGVDLP